MHLSTRPRDRRFFYVLSRRRRFNRLTGLTVQVFSAKFYDNNLGDSDLCVLGGFVLNY